MEHEILDYMQQKVQKMKLQSVTYINNWIQGLNLRGGDTYDSFSQVNLYEREIESAQSYIRRYVGSSFQHAVTGW